MKKQEYLDVDNLKGTEKKLDLNSLGKKPTVPKPKARNPSRLTRTKVRGFTKEKKTGYAAYAEGKEGTYNIWQHRR